MTRIERRLKQKWYKKKINWMWGILLFIAGGVFYQLSPTTFDTNETIQQTITQGETKPTVKVKKKKIIPQKQETFIKPKEKISKIEKSKETIPTEFKSALKSAETYSKMMHMSKKGIFDQRTSEYADKFSAEAAQYAIDTIKADWKENALKSAKTYQDDMSMSPEGIREQLTSEYGGQFTADEANYAVEHLE